MPVPRLPLLYWDYNSIHLRGSLAIAKANVFEGFKEILSCKMYSVRSTITLIFRVKYCLMCLTKSCLYMGQPPLLSCTELPFRPLSSPRLSLHMLSLKCISKCFAKNTILFFLCHYSILGSQFKHPLLAHLWLDQVYLWALQFYKSPSPVFQRTIKMCFFNFGEICKQITIWCHQAYKYL